MIGPIQAVVVGGGVVGSSIAYFLTVLGPQGRVVVIEREPQLANAATARSAGGIRRQFSTKENIWLSQASLEIIRDLNIENEVGFHERGYLILASSDGMPVLQANVALQTSEGVDVVVEDAAQLRRRFDWLSAVGIKAGAFGRTGEGWIDPISLTWALKRRAQAAGAAFVAGEVCAVDVVHGRAAAVRLASGERFECRFLINAAGPWAGQLAAMAGVALPVEPRKRYIYVIDCRHPPDSLSAAPLTVDPSGVWFRPEGRMFLAGRSPDPDQEPTDLDLERIDFDYFDAAIWPELATRVPAFEAIKVVRAWAGYYDFNTFDQNGIIGAHPDIENFLMANGFSGHGLQQGPAVGRAIAELVSEGGYHSLDLSRLGYERLTQGTPLVERSVI